MSLEVFVTLNQQLLRQKHIVIYNSPGKVVDLLKVKQRPQHVGFQVGPGPHEVEVGRVWVGFVEAVRSEHAANQSALRSHQFVGHVILGWR